MMKNIFIILFALWLTEDMTAGEWLVTKPTLIKKDTKPAGGLLTSGIVESIFQCAFLCTQNINCVRLSFNGKWCNTFGPVFPTPNPEWVAADGYTTYRARNKIFKFINDALSFDKASQACKREFGGRLASTADMESFQLLARLLKEENACGKPDAGFLIGLRSKGRSGIFEWDNGEIVDVVKGTGFQRWHPGNEPVMYKTNDVVVKARSCGKDFGDWVEEPANTTRWMICETP